MNQKGFASIFIVLGIVLILSIAGGAYFLNKKSNFVAPKEVPITLTPTPIKTITPTISIVSSGSAQYASPEGSLPKYSFNYPAKWVVEPSQNGVVLQTFATPSEPHGGWAGGPNDIRIGMYFTKETANQTLDQLVEKVAKDRTIQTRQSSSIAGLPAIRITYKDEINEGMPEVYFLKDDYFFQISLIYGDNAKAIAENNFLQILTTFKFSSQNQISAQECSSSDGSIKLTLDEAKQIALKSDCLKEGTFTNTGDYCNNITETWWLTMKPTTGNCGLACVVNVKTKTAGAQYMCTGAIPPGI